MWLDSLWSLLRLRGFQGLTYPIAQQPEASKSVSWASGFKQKKKISANTIFTWCQFWPSGIVITCICVYMCVCVRLCVCVSIPELVSAITHHHHLFKLALPNLDQRCKTPWFRSLYCFCFFGVGWGWGRGGWPYLYLQDQLNLKIQIYYILSLFTP